MVDSTRRLHNHVHHVHHPRIGGGRSSRHLFAFVGGGVVFCLSHFNVIEKKCQDPPPQAESPPEGFWHFYSNTKFKMNQVINISKMKYRSLRARATSASSYYSTVGTPSLAMQREQSSSRKKN